MNLLSARRGGVRGGGGLAGGGRSDGREDEDDAENEDEDIARTLSRIRRVRRCTRIVADVIIVGDAPRSAKRHAAKTAKRARQNCRRSETATLVGGRFAALVTLIAFNMSSSTRDMSRFPHSRSLSFARSLARSWKNGKVSKKTGGRRGRENERVNA